MPRPLTPSSQTVKSVTLCAGTHRGRERHAERMERIERERSKAAGYLTARLTLKAYDRSNGRYVDVTGHAYRIETASAHELTRAADLIAEFVALLPYASPSAIRAALAAIPRTGAPAPPSARQLRDWKRLDTLARKAAAKANDALPPEQRPCARPDSIHDEEF